MAAKIILLLDSAGVTAHKWSNGHVRQEGEFHADAAGLEAFADYLCKRRSSIFHLLADVTEEGFQLEDIPYVQGGDRSALLKRRLSQYFYGTPLSLALSLGRQQQGRRDEKILFSALTRAETFAPWLEALRGAEVTFAGVYSMPLVLGEFGPRIVAGDGPRLLINISRGGVRQSFFNQGKLQFSRLSSLATRGIEEIGIACGSEAAKIHQYLIGQRQIPRGTMLPAVVLAHHDQIDILRRHCQDTAEISFEFADISTVARREGLKDRPADSHAELLCVHRLAVKTPRQQFAEAADRKLFNLWQIRFALSSFAWIALVTCLLFAGKTLLQTYEQQQDTGRLTAQIAADNQRYQAILDGLPKVAVTPENLRAFIARYDELQKGRPSMEPVLYHLSHVLNDLPKIDLVRLEWQAGAGKDSLDVTAQLPPVLASDMRAQLNQINGFADRLRSPQFDVSVTSMPFDIEPGKSLKSQNEKAVAQTPVAPKFSLRIARKS